MAALTLVGAVHGQKIEAAAWAARLADPAELPALRTSAEAAALLRLVALGELPADATTDELRLTATERERGSAWLLQASPELVRRTVAELDPVVDEQAVRVAALEWLTPVAGAHDVSLALRLAAPAEGATRVPAALRRAFEALAEAVGTREGDGVAALGRAFDEAPLGLLAGLVQGVGGGRSSQSLVVLAGFLRQVPELDPLVLSEIARVATDVRELRDSSVLDAVRRYLDFDGSLLRQEAALAAAALGDDEAIPGLIALLEEEDSNVARTAHAALQQLTSRRYKAHPEPWLAWYDDELTWWSGRGRTLMRELEVGSPAQISSGLREVLAHRLNRHQLAEAVAGCLERREPDLVRVACAVLGHLQSPAVLDDLVATLKHPDPRVQDAAREALVKITGSESAAEALTSPDRRAGRRGSAAGK